MNRNSGPDLGDKFLPVVVKAVEAFMVTAYVTARQKKGVRVWPENVMRKRDADGTLLAISIFNLSSFARTRPHPESISGHDLA